MAIADTASLPVCTATNEGWLIYVTAKKDFEVCTSNAWISLDDPTASFFCSGVLPSPTPNNIGLSFGYNISFSGGAGGDVIATGSIIDLAGEHSDSMFYVAGTGGASGASSGLIEIFADYETTHVGAYWDLSFDDTKLTLAISYTVPPATTPGLTWTLPASDCIKEGVASSHSP